MPRSRCRFQMSIRLSKTLRSRINSGAPSPDVYVPRLKDRSCLVLTRIRLIHCSVSPVLSPAFRTSMIFTTVWIRIVNNLHQCMDQNCPCCPALFRVSLDFMQVSKYGSLVTMVRNGRHSAYAFVILSCFSGRRRKQTKIIGPQMIELPCSEMAWIPCRESCVNRLLVTVTGI
jgi:hypothetical protein